MTLFGQLGNQLWQIAFAVYLRTIHEMPIRLVGDLDLNLHPLTEALDIKVYKLPVKHLYKRYIQFLMTPFIVPDSRHSMLYPYQFRKRYFVGYWQNKGYLTDEFLCGFRKWRDDQVKKNWNVSSKHMKERLANVLCVHVRLGDFVGTKHDILTSNYYNDAFDIYRKKNIAKTLILSNNYDQALRMVTDLNDEIVDHFRIIDLEKRGYMEEFCIMACSENLIISNSSFGWWGALDASSVVAPHFWYNDGKHYAGIYPRNWTTLRV